MKRRRRFRLRPLTVAAAVLGVWLLAAGVQAARAYSELEAGSDLAERLRGDLTAEAIVEGEVSTDLRAAQRRFAAGERHARGILLAPARILPVAGRQLRSVIALADAAESVSATGADAAAAAADVLAEPPDSGRERVRVMREIASIAQSSEQRLEDLELGPDEGLLAPLHRRRATFADRLGQLTGTLRRTGDAAQAAADLIDGPSQYLLLAANNAEMRAGSGMFLSAGVLSASDGHLELGEMEPTPDLFLSDGAVPTDPDLAARWGWLQPGQEWRNLGVTPRFDVTGELATRMWRKVNNDRVDGVIAVDIAGLRALIAATGPVTVEDQRVDKTNVVDFLMHDQYGSLEDDFYEAQRERRELLGGIAQRTVSALSAGEYDIGRLAEGLADAAAGRHLMVWSRAEAAQDAWESIGLSGTVPSDSLMAAVLNRGGTKLDRFLHVEATMSVDSNGRGTSVALTLDLVNRTPDGEVRYIAGPYPGTPFAYGEYVGLVAITLPGDARRARFEAVDSLAVAGADGPTRVVATEFRLEPGERTTIEATFDLPPGVGGLTVLPSARIPSVKWRGPEGLRWTDARPQTVTW